MKQINDVLSNIKKAKDLLEDLENRIGEDLQTELKAYSNGYYIDGLKSSASDIERVGILARKYIKDMYSSEGEGYYNQVKKSIKNN